MTERYRVGSDAGDLVELLTEGGLAVLDGLADRNDLLRLAHSLAAVVPHRDSGPDGVTTLRDLGDPTVPRGFAGFSALALAPHTDRSGVANPPALLMMCCSQPAAAGGQCVLIDDQAVYDDLAVNSPEVLNALSTPRSARFGGAGGYLGSVFTPRGDGRTDVRLRLDDLARFAPEVVRWLPVLRATIDRHALELDLRAGQGYVLDNHRWLHGRRAFTGSRVVHRVNGDPLPSLGIRTGLRAHVSCAAS